jgi:N-acetylmuramoyl-L-alanine amidase
MPKPLYITGGHQVLNGKGTGAHGVDGFDEAKEARKLVTDIIAHQKKWYGLDALTDKDSDTLNAVIAHQVKVVEKDFVCIDVHFNAGPASATGCEVFIPTTHTDEEQALAKELVTAISDTLGLKKRGGKLKALGVKTEAESQHPRIGMLSKPYKGLNVLLEICFITNEKDVKAYKDNYFKLVQKLSDVLGNYRKQEVAV